MEIAGTVSGILAQKGSTVWSTAPTAIVFDAIALMADKNVGALPVVENDKLVFRQQAAAEGALSS